MKIKAILHIMNSKADRYGNRYWAFHYTDCKTGKRVFGTFGGGDSNISIVFNYRAWNNWSWDKIHTTRTELPIREFNAIVEGWQDAGCEKDEIADFIRRGLRKRKPAA